jgi:hypothetical protein
MKKLFLAVAVVVTSLSITGCATRTQTAILAGTTGVIIGSALSQPRVVHAPVVHQEVVIINDQCSVYPTVGERSACLRGSRQRYYEEQRRRENEAFRQGLGR